MSIDEPYLEIEMVPRHQVTETIVVPRTTQTDEEQRELTDEELARLPYEELIARNGCVVCLQPLERGLLGNWALMGLAWTDTHGVAHHGCGATYTVLHYEGNPDYDPSAAEMFINPNGMRNLKNRPISRPPTCIFAPEFIPVLRQYWRETRLPVSPGAYCFPGSSYSNATEENVESWHRWNKEHEAELESLFSISTARIEFELREGLVI